MDTVTAGAEPQRTRLARAIQQARAAGRAYLLEHEGLQVAEALGLRVPRHVFVVDAAAAGAADWATLGGDRVVVKIVSPRIQHKTDVDGVAIVDRDSGVIARTVADMMRRLAPHEPGGCLVSEYVAHDKDAGTQLVVGMRWSQAFGPVVTLGLGGVDVELLAKASDRSLAVFAPRLTSATHLDAALHQTWWAPLLTEPRRNLPPRFPLSELHDLVRRFVRFANACMPHDLVEFEINPLLITQNGPVAVDVLARLGADVPSPLPPRPRGKIDNLLHPRSMAIIGVSERMNPGHIVLKNVLDAGFDPRNIHVIKPGHDRIEGCLCIPRLRDLRSSVDLLVVCVDASQVPEIISDCVHRRLAESVIVVPGGIGEHAASADFAARTRASVDASRTTPWHGPVLNGGNCLGIRSVPGRVNTLFIPHHKLRFRTGSADPVALISQSGAFAVARSTRFPWLNPRYVVTFGNQLDLTMGDYLQHLKDDDSIEVYACYVEGFATLDGCDWLDAAAEIVARGRCVILYQAVRTREGAQAAASHTASIAGDYAVTRSLARSAGVLVAETPQDFDDLMRVATLLHRKHVDGMRLGAVSNAGFESVAIADFTGSFSLPSFGAETCEHVESLCKDARLDSVVTIRNPLDVTPIFDDVRFESAARAVCDDSNVDVAVIGCVPFSGALSTLPESSRYSEDVSRPDSIAQRLVRLHLRSRKAWVAVVDAGAAFDPMVEILESGGVPTFRSADRALRAFSKYCAWRCRHPDVPSDQESIAGV